LDEAVAAYRKADQLLPNHPLIRNNLRHAEGLLQLDRKLTACLAGKGRPATPREAVALGAVCAQFRQRYHAAVPFFVDAFQADATLANDMQSGHRYNAACSAALAAAGQGEDAAALDDKERARLRKQTLDWLDADRKAWGRKLDGKPAKVVRDRAAAALRHWQGDADLASVRHPWSLLRLPAEERRGWQQLWANVDALRQRAASAR
jgi:hypothetical protein